LETIKKKKKKRLRNYVVFIVIVANFENWFGFPFVAVALYARYSDPLNAVPNGAAVGWPTADPVVE
jgi:hypothetical protein